MSEKEKKIIETFCQIVPKLSDSSKNYLLGLGEGMSIKIERATESKESEQQHQTT